MGLKFGLDIGIASVGYAVVNDEFEMIAVGVRLFDSADASKNEMRRSRRGARRLTRRKAHRLVRMNKLFEMYGIEYSNTQNQDSLVFRNKGLEEKLTEDELYCALKHLMKHRGITYLEDAVDDGVGSEYKKALSNNAKEIKNAYPCQIQLNRLEEIGSYRGDKIINETPYSNVFTISAYKREIEKLLEVQREYHSFITDDFINDYLDIFSSKREYYVGPGNDNSRTNYGKYTTRIDENGDYITLDNIFENLIGRCTIYKDKFRASAASYTAQEFNLLNDLNNLNVNNRKLTEDEKRKIVSTVKVSSSVNMRKIIKKVIGEEISCFSGARIDKKEKEIFHTFDIYRKLKKNLTGKGIEVDNYSIEQLDRIAHVLTINTEKESILSGFEREEKLNNISDEDKEAFISFRKSNGSLFSKWHSFSLKLMNELMEDLYELPKNQMQLLTELGKFRSTEDLFKDAITIPSAQVVEEIYNPIVKRAVIQSVKVLNALIKEHGYPNDIVIEMARDKNEDEQKKRIKDFQKKNEKEIFEILSRVKNEYDIKITDNDFRKQKALKTKLRLWNEQGGKCLYSGKGIHISDLLNNFNIFEIDHIIPLSISFDDSRSNKVLVYKSENQQKGNRTPYMYLSGVQREWNYIRFEKYVKGLKLNRKKTSNLLFRENITKQEVLKGFISRNLNDTRYASRVVLNTIQSYMKSKDADTKVKVINGSFTSQLRNRLGVVKDREEGYHHHGIDAMVICYSHMGLNNYKYLNRDIIDFDTGEIIDNKRFENLSDDEQYEQKIFYNRIIKIKANIKHAYEVMKFSHKVDKKVNRQLTNETIYGTRVNNDDGKTYKISKINNIYDDNDYKKLQNLIDKKKHTNLLVYRNDRKTYDELLKIMDMYSDAKNPFVAYKKDMNEAVRKYSRKGNGPFIKSLKYYDGEVGSHIDISHKYGHEKGSKKVVLDSLKPYRADVYYNTKKECYHIVGVKYADFKFDKGDYVLHIERYEKLLKKEGVIEQDNSYGELEELGIEFCFSLYKNDIILYGKKGVEYKERFLSRTMPNDKNYIETKPINASKFDKRHLIGLTATKKILKINTDVLGNEHITTKEKFVLKVCLDK